MAEGCLMQAILTESYIFYQCDLIAGSVHTVNAIIVLLFARQEADLPFPAKIHNLKNA